MAQTGNWLKTEELNDIITAVSELTTAYRTIKRLKNLGFDVFTDAEGFGVTFTIRDLNGDVVGHLGIGEDDDIVMYLDDGTDA